MDSWSQVLFPILDTLIKVLLPVVAGYAINYFNKKLGRERFMHAREIISSVVTSLEQQYRSGEIPKDDRFALALEHGIQRTGLTEEQVALLIKDAVFQMNAALGKYDYSNSSQGFVLKSEDSSVSSTEKQPTTPVVALEKDSGLIDRLVIPGQQI